MSIQYVMPKNAKELEAIHSTAIQSVNTARVNVQIAAVATLRHAYVHGDWTYAQKLVDGLGNTINGKALVEWFKVYGGLEVGDEGFIAWSGKDYIKEKFQEAKEKMWWDLKIANPYKGFNLEEALQRVLKDHAKAKDQLAKLPEDQKEKVVLTANEATIQAVLKLVNFEQLLEPKQDEEEQAA